jgi:hypothetical protein
VGSKRLISMPDRMTNAVRGEGEREREKREGGTEGGTEEGRGGVGEERDKDRGERERERERAKERGKGGGRRESRERDRELKVRRETEHTMHFRECFHEMLQIYGDIRAHACARFISICAYPCTHSPVGILCLMSIHHPYPSRADVLDGSPSLSRARSLPLSPPPPLPLSLSLARALSIMNL